MSRQSVPRSYSSALAIASELAGAEGAPMPSFIEPCFASPRPKPPATDNWVHEIKFDGYRLQVHVDNGKVHCYTRRGYDWRERFPTVASAAWKLKVDSAILDGEVVVVSKSGDTDFAALESYVAGKDPEHSPHHLVYYAFDLLYLNGLDLRRAPLIGRKQALQGLLQGQEDNGPLRYSEHLEGSGIDIHHQACDLALEGIVSKRKDSPYRSGRNDTWTKSTCRHRDTFVIAGLAHKGSRFDGIYLGQRKGRQLVYAGKVEIGFSEEQVKRLKERAARLKAKKQPIKAERDFPKAEWLKPELLAEVEYRRKTASGLLRHPSYKGMREDLGTKN
jgi:bifunctional non-homologous end joining protein LigD